MRDTGIFLMLVVKTGVMGCLRAAAAAIVRHKQVEPRLYRINLRGAHAARGDSPGHDHYIDRRAPQQCRHTAGVFQPGHLADLARVTGMVASSPSSSLPVKAEPKSR